MVSVGVIVQVGLTVGPTRVGVKVGITNGVA
jgi:hypothetical protein